MTEDSERTAPKSGRIRLLYARVIMGLARPGLADFPFRLDSVS